MANKQVDKNTVSFLVILEENSVIQTLFLNIPEIGIVPPMWGTEDSFNLTPTTRSVLPQFLPISFISSSESMHL